MKLLTAAILDKAGNSLGGFLPRLGGAIALLLVGLIAARLLGAITRKLLERIGADGLADRWRVHDALRRLGIDSPVSAVIGRTIRIGLSLVVIFAALSLLGLQFLSASLNAGVLLLPKLAVAAALLLAGVVLGGFAREWVDRLSFQMGLPSPLGRVAQVLLVAVFAITAAAQVAVSTALLLIVVGILLAAGAAMIALAFGLGGSEVARQLSAGRYVRSTYRPGQRLGFESVSGTVVSVETASTVLETDDGKTIHVPNSMLLGSIVTVEAPGEDPAS